MPTARVAVMPLKANRREVGFGDRLQKFGNGKRLVQHCNMVDLAEEALAVIVLSASDKNHRQLVSGRSQTLKKLHRVHFGHEQVEHDAAARLEVEPENIFRTIERHRPETRQADQPPERAQKRYIIVHQHY